MKTISTQFRYARIIPPPSLVAREGKDDDEDEEKKFLDRVNKAVVGILKDRDKTESKNRKKEIDDALAAHTKAITDSVGATMKDMLAEYAKTTPGGADDGKKKKDGSEGGDPEARAALAKMQKALDDSKTMIDKLTADTAAEKQKAVDADSRAKRQEEMQTLTTALTEAKVRPGILRMATEDIHKRFIGRDPDSGEIRWRDGDDLVDMKDPKKGLAKFLSTEEGKELLPPVNAGGSGSGRAGGGGGKAGEKSGWDVLANRLDTSNG